MACISAETGTLTFAIINLVLATLSTLGSLGLLVFWGYLSLTGQFWPEPNQSETLEVAYAAQSVMIVVLIFVMLTFSLVSLMFASFLMNGILKKKPEHIKVYYIFGIVKIVMSLLFIIGAYTTSIQDIEPASVAAVVVYYFIYSLILYMIRRTYMQYDTINDQFNHKPLVEKC